MNKNKKTLIIFVAVLVLNIALAGAYLFAFNIVKIQSEKAAASTLALQAYQASGDRVAVMQRIIEDVKNDELELDRHFVTEDSVVDFIEAIESAGDVAGVDLVLSGLRKDGENELAFSISANGSFQSLMNFMALMENMPFIIDAERVSLSRQGADATGLVRGAWGGTFAFQLRGYTGE